MKPKRLHRRLDDFIDVLISFEKTKENIVKINSKTCDISAGGIRIYLGTRFKIGTKVQVVVVLSKKNKILDPAAEIVDVKLVGVIGDRGEQRVYDTRIKFCKIGAVQKSEIIRYVYACDKKRREAATRKK